MCSKILACWMKIIEDLFPDMHIEYCIGQWSRHGQEVSLRGDIILMKMMMESRRMISMTQQQNLLRKDSVINASFMKG